MSTKTAHHPSARPRSEYAKRSFEKIVDSDILKAAHALRNLLQFLWDHQGESLSEYAIAVLALGRHEGFDPKIDATVRVLISRLRNKLREFYEREGLTFPLQVSIPLGSHELEWTLNEPVAKASWWSSCLQIPKPYRNLMLGSVCVGGLLVVICTSLLLQVRRLEAALPPPAAKLPRFWRSFLMAGKPPVIVVPSPVYFRWPNNVVVRDFAISDFSAWQQSDTIRRLSDNWGPPSLFQFYVSVLDMKAGLALQHYLERQGVSAELTESRTFELTSGSVRNAIFLGVPRTTEYLKQLFDKTNFYHLTVDSPIVIKNRAPKPGEPAEFREKDYSTDHKIFPELVMLLPPRADGGRDLILFGFMPMALTSMLQSNEGLQLIDRQWKMTGSPDSWEMVVQAEMNGETVLKVWPVSMRAIPTASLN